MRQVGFSDNAHAGDKCALAAGCGYLFPLLRTQLLHRLLARCKQLLLLLGRGGGPHLRHEGERLRQGTASGVGFGVWSEEPHGGDRAGGAPCTAECRRAAHPRSTTSSYPSAACRAEIGQRTGVICEAGLQESANGAIGTGSPQRPLGSSSHREHQDPFRPPFRRAMR